MAAPQDDAPVESDSTADRTRRIALLRIWGPSLLVVLIGFVVAYQFMDPAPPQRITLLTGPAGGAYAEFGRRYMEELTDILHDGDSLQLDIQESAGSTENLRLLREGKADVAFIQGGVAKPPLPAAVADATPRDGTTPITLEAMGTVYLEPLWVFYRGEEDLARLTQLEGKRIAIGGSDSGTEALSLLLLEDNGIGPEEARLLDLGGAEAVDALMNGEVDAAFFVISATSPWVQELLVAPGVRLMNFSRHLAYRGKHRFLTSVVLGEGVMDLEANVPNRDYTLLAPAAMLVANAELHPALTGLLLQVAKRVHGEKGAFVHMGPFPTPLFVDDAFPLDEDARRYYEFGPSILQRYLPFWAATFIDRMKIMLLPLVTLLLPLIKLGPPIYVWRTRLKIYRWYSVLREIDQRHVAGGTESAARRDLRRLEQLEKELNDISVPLSYMTEFYDLRIHIAHVRAKLERS